VRNPGSAVSLEARAPLFLYDDAVSKSQTATGITSVVGCLFLFACSYGGLWKPVSAPGIERSKTIRKNDTAALELLDGVSASIQGLLGRGESSFLVKLSNRTEHPIELDLKNLLFTVVPDQQASVPREYRVQHFLHELLPGKTPAPGPGSQESCGEKAAEFGSEREYLLSLPLTISSQKEMLFKIIFKVAPVKGWRGHLAIPLIQQGKTRQAEVEFRAARR